MQAQDSPPAPPVITVVTSDHDGQSLRAGDIVNYTVRYLVYPWHTTEESSYVDPTIKFEILSNNASIENYSCAATPYLFHYDSPAGMYADLTELDPLNDTFPVCPASTDPKVLDFATIRLGAEDDFSNVPCVDGCGGVSVVVLSYTVAVRVNQMITANNHITVKSTVTQGIIDRSSGEYYEFAMEDGIELPTSVAAVLGASTVQTTRSNPVIASNNNLPPPPTSSPTETPAPKPEPEHREQLANTGSNTIIPIAASVVLVLVSLIFAIQRQYVLKS